MKTVKKYGRLALILFLLICYLLMYPGIVKYYWYQIFDPNDKVEMLDFDQVEIQSYQDILFSEQIPNKVSLIYPNSRWDYEFLEKQIPLINEIQSKYGNSNLNFIYTALGLESNFRDEIKWYNSMKDLDLIGYHTSLLFDFEEYHTLWRKTRTDEGVAREYPILLLMDKNGVKIDTMFYWDEHNPKERDELLRNLDKLMSETTNTQ